MQSSRHRDMRAGRSSHERRRASNGRIVQAIAGGALAITLAAGAFATSSGLLPIGGEGDPGWAAGADGPTGAAASPKPPAAVVATTQQQIVRDGLRIAFSITPATADAAELRLTLSDPETGAPFQPGQRPLVWADLQKEAIGLQSGSTCEDKVQLFSQGQLGYKPEVDLNSYYVLALNSDPSISVIDPLTTVAGMTQLYALVPLKSPGADWVVSLDNQRLFVSMPRTGQLAVVDLATFTPVVTLDVGPRATRLVWQPGGRFLWVANDSSDRNTSGVTVVDTQELRVVAQIPTGAGEHRIAFTGGSRTEAAVPHHEHDRHTAPAAIDSDEPSYAVVTNHESGTLTVIDGAALRTIKDLSAGGKPNDIAVSDASKAVYVAVDTAEVDVVDPALLDIVSHIDGMKGSKALRFAPGGRWGFTLAGGGSTLQVFDTTTNQLVQTVDVQAGSDQVSFSERYAYIHSAEATDMTVVDVAALDDPEQLTTFRISAGQRPPSETNISPMADAIAPAHDSGTLVANPSDQYVYMYMEGMNQPMGGFQNYGHAPQAARVVERGLTELSPGAYTAQVRVRRAGDYDLAVLVDEPRVAQCFTFHAAPAADAVSASESDLGLEVLNDQRESTAGEPLSFLFRLTSGGGTVAVDGLDNVQVVATLSSGLRTQRVLAVPGEDGTYRADLVLDTPGLYTLRVAAPTRGVGIGKLPATGVRVN